MKIKAGVLTVCGAQRPFAKSKPIHVLEVDLDPPGEGEVLVKVGGGGLCHSDLSLINGDRPRPVPIVLGHEGAGEVVEVGAGVHDVKKGDHVCFTFNVSCGRCRRCLEGRPYICERSVSPRAAGQLLSGHHRLHFDGKPVNHHSGVSCYAEYAVVDRGSIVVIDRSLPLDLAALFGCAVVTGVGAVVNTAKVTPGANVVVFGLGGIGLNVIQGARMVGADKIIGVDINDSKEEWGRRFGMTHFVNPKKVDGDIVAHLVGLTDGGADYTFDCTGNTTVMRQALEACHRGWGVSVVIGVAESGKEIATRPFQLVTGRVWKGTAFGGARGRTDVPKIVDWYMNGKIQIDPMITHVLKLDEINKGFDLMHEGKSIRSVVVF